MNENEYQGQNGPYQPGGSYVPPAENFTPGQAGGGAGPDFQYTEGEIPPDPKKKKWIPWLIGGAGVAVVAVLAVIFVPRAMADPHERVMEAFKGMAANASSPIAEEIGWEQMQEAMAESAFFQGEFSLKELPSSAGVGAALFGGFSLRMEGAMDLEAKEGGLELALAAGDSDLFSGEIYLNDEMLALSLPQLYEGALAVGTGNLREQLENSPLFDQMNLSEADLELLDFPLDFFPENDASGNLATAMAEDLETFQNAVQVEELDQKETIEIGGGSQECQGYLVIVPRDAAITMLEDLWDSYAAYMEELLAVYENYSLYGDLQVGIQQTETEIQDAFAQLESVLSSELELEVFLTSSGELAQVYVDDVMNWIQADYRDGSSVGLQLTFQGAEKPGDSFRLEMMDRAGDESILLEKTGRLEGEDLFTQYRLVQNFDGEEAELLFVDGSYLADSRTFSYQVQMPEEDLSFFLEGSLGEVQSGESVEYLIDAAGFTVYGETLSVQGSLKIGSGTGGLTAPETVQMVLELSEDEILDLSEEIQTNLQTWMGGLTGALY